MKNNNESINNNRNNFIKKIIGRTILAVVFMILSAIAITSGYIISNAKAMWEDRVPIVSKPALTAEPIPEPSLELLYTPSPGNGGLITNIPVLTADAEDDYINSTYAASSTMPIYEEPPIDEETINILLVGLDARPGDTFCRSDSMVLLSYNRKLQSVALISFLRDTWVPITGYGWNRLNACYAFGGIGLTINTINEQFNLDIQNYVIIRFEEMEGVIDELGGVTVYLSQEEADYYNKRNPGHTLLEEGMQLLDGSLTLQHTRNRYVGCADFDRTRRQRDVILAIYDKVKHMNDPAKFTKLLNYSFDNVKTNLSLEVIMWLAENSFGCPDLEFIQGQVPNENTWQYARIDGKSVLKVNIEKNTEYLANLLPWDLNSGD